MPFILVSLGGTRNPSLPPKSTTGPSDSGSGVEREARTESIETVQKMCSDIRTFLTRHEETTKEALKEYREDLREVKILLASHDHILNALVANQATGAVPEQVRKHVGETGTSVAEHVYISLAPAPDTTLKRKLDFTTEDSTTEDLSECFDLEFPPPDGFEFAGMELAYIFGKDLDDGKVLVKGVHGIGDERTMKSLCPGKQFYDDAYVPLHKDNHWYLMIVHFHDNELVYLDSTKVDSETVACKAQMRIVVVNAGTRMRLEIDLVMGIHNPLRHDMTRISVEEWDKTCRKAMRRSKKKDPRI
ncbi:hypothetical protein PIB30_017185 [Stylosanthes scabra]|uniref:Ubiquitin-like protease family profile domain-containing protein n=1 Tax=Stylosanthes scabra TaxID=79078 RepID=A0ABU6X508_9FABA|nr:hypothetical protein [Stylosanthes scabra]